MKKALRELQARLGHLGNDIESIVNRQVGEANDRIAESQQNQQNNGYSQQYTGNTYNGNQGGHGSPGRHGAHGRQEQSF